jgi:phosphoglycerol geranylgeranyltransferase
MMNLDYTKWKHVTKLDPDKDISKEQIEQIIEAGTDAIMISGTQNITRENVCQLIAMLEEYTVPKVLEPVTPDAVVYSGIDYIFVPSVFNTKTEEWTIGRHVEWIKEQKWKVMKSNVIVEAYILLNSDAAVTKLTEADANLSIETVEAYSLLAEFFGIPIVYLEYSGMYGDPKVVKAVSNVLEKSRLFYGGGIDSKERAKEMLKHADTIVVGNIFYDNFEKGLETII